MPHTTHSEIFHHLLTLRAANTFLTSKDHPLSTLHLQTPPPPSWLHLPHLPLSTHTLSPADFPSSLLQTATPLPHLMPQPKQLQVQLKATVQDILSFHSKALKRNPAHSLPSYTLPAPDLNQPATLLAPLLAMLFFKHTPQKLAHHAHLWLLDCDQKPYLPTLQALYEAAASLKASTAPPVPPTPAPIEPPAPAVSHTPAPIEPPALPVAPTPAPIEPPAPPVAPTPAPIEPPAPPVAPTPAPIEPPALPVAPTPAPIEPPAPPVSPTPAPIEPPAPPVSPTPAPIEPPAPPVSPTPAPIEPPAPPVSPTPAPIEPPALPVPPTPAPIEPPAPAVSHTPETIEPSAPETSTRQRQTRRAQSTPRQNSEHITSSRPAPSTKPPAPARKNKLDIKYQPKYTSLIPLGNVLSFLKYNGMPLTPQQIKKEVPLPVLNALNDSMTEAARQILITKIFLEQKTAQQNLPPPDLIDALVIYTRAVSPKILDEEIITSDQIEITSISDIRHFIKENS